ncbi:Outer membrane protein beta-barrel domain-containing protein [Chitinophaga jiangningensis]|uniref:Outer membrane protein beta-barrel domain-containing protein n=1 Tax=Chitinophaga jiangningensis TaxID=1419482 RepID=A0A1M7MHI6_9BACT|nr:porin family protein [Chitinophaga jiangningensis]SHM90406.1 Outer membrane protein beta-barrel domain-containing protein [Chitinophaga jiangningensis]
MKKILNWIMIFAGVFAAQAVSAQVRPPLSIDVNYSVASPLGSLKDYSGKTSFRGWTAGLQYMLNDQLSVGLRTGFQDFNEKLPRAVYPDKLGDVSAVQTRTLQVIPIQATAGWAFTKPDKPVIPYAAVGVGVANMDYKKYWGQFVESDNSWQFMVSPEVGVNIPFGQASPVLFNANVRYNYSPYKMGDITNFNSVQYSVGFKFHLN